MGLEQIVLVLIGAFAGGIVNGLTGFGTAITAIGIWLYAFPPTVAASLAIICSVVSQTQTLHLIWRTIRWDRLLPFVLPGVLGVPLGTYLLPHIDPRFFKLGVGIFLVVYSAYVLARKGEIKSAWGGRAADGAAGFGGGILGGLTGLSGVLPVVWTDVRGWTKEQRRSVVQTFNMAILSLALVSHALSGLLTRQVAVQAAVALPATITGAWFGAYIYRRLADRGYQRAVMVLLFLSGAGLIWTSW
ncbi:MAG TPA: sulfite exporter TauE/SafE family protein [Xanthobacteraceae bacterium]|nr:sulfite exporter TauE/SafE family protein [Xanthobacteraceae bacterium]